MLRSGLTRALFSALAVVGGLVGIGGLAVTGTVPAWVPGDRAHLVVMGTTLI